MKRLSISILAVIFSLGAAFSQPVSELGIIPVGVTLNSILRLNITSGGNLEYVINTIDQYQGGIAAGAPYTTNFNVASSVNFDVSIIADADDFTGVDNNTSANTMALNNLAYIMGENGSGTDGTEWVLNTTATGLPCAVTGPTDGAEIIVLGSTTVANPSAGGIDQNAFIINWQFGTHIVGGVVPMNAASLLAQSIASDRYVVNVFLELAGK